MAREQDAIHVIGLPLEPVSPRKHARDRRNRRKIIRFEPDPDALVQLRGEEMIDDIEPEVARPDNRRRTRQ